MIDSLERCLDMATEFGCKIEVVGISRSSCSSCFVSVTAR